MEFKNFITNFLFPNRATKKLHKEIQEQRTRIRQLILEYDTASRWKMQYSSILGTLTESMQALVWQKDKHHKYILANPLHCEKFFGLDLTTDCLKYIVGKSDLELINDFYTFRGIQNTMGNMCIKSDSYTEGANKICHFLEGGIVDSKEVLFYVIKTPRFSESGKFIGSVGIGWDFTEQADFLLNQLNRWVYSNKAMEIHKKDNVYCYLVAPEVKQCKIFHHICPESYIKP